MDDVSYGVLALALTLVFGVATWFAYQRRGLGAGLKGAGITLLPLAAYLTKTLEMFARVGDAIGDWAVRLVLSPVVWVGIAVAGVAVLLFGAGRVVDRRGGGAAPRRQRKQRAGTDPAALPPTAAAPSAAANRQKGAPAIDDDLADIEAILKSRGIS
ncbi:cellulose synthase [Nocardioides dongxiaopingii]|uniref:cellulose synthase n=1 Tax=Nocardioides TaxID=1839 RepID=UPI0010C764E5|nr:MULTISPECIES: cellulose synthase [Nocardioides]QCW50918.1 cellulose synthase [Nocardioides sp. S-1144]